MNEIDGLGEADAAEGVEMTRQNHHREIVEGERGAVSGGCGALGHHG